MRAKCKDYIRNEQLTTTLICKEKKQVEEALKRVKKKNGETTEKWKKSWKK
jgi:hypothetical protein